MSFRPIDGNDDRIPVSWPLNNTQLRAGGTGNKLPTSTPRAPSGLLS